MRICNYPGRAVDATLALDQKSPMETLYQNNWLNADKTIKTIGRKSAAARNHLLAESEPASIQQAIDTYRSDDRRCDRKYISQSSGSNGSSSAQQSSSDDENRRTSISSLGRYQLTLEQMQKLDLNDSNELFRKTMRNLNGYKPSTIRQKHRRNYAGWDEFKEKATIDEETKRINQNADRSAHSLPVLNGDVKYYQAFDSNKHSKKVILIPKIKRSQTMRITTTMCPSSSSQSSPSTPPPLLSSMNGNGGRTVNGTATINLRNVFNRQQSHEEQKQLQRMPATATISKNFNRFKRNHLPSIRNGTNNDDRNDYDDGENGTDDEDKPRRNGHSNNINNTNNRSGNFVAANNGSSTSECIIPSNFSQFTMKSNGCIKNDQQKPNGTCDNEFELRSSALPLAPSTLSKKKPLLRAKSVRINPTPLQDIYYDRRESYGETKTTGTNGISTNCDKRSSNCINNNNNHQQNGTNGTSERLTLKQKLPRLTSIMKKKPIVIADETPLRPRSKPPPQTPPPPPPQQQQQMVQQLPPDSGKPILDQWINFYHKKDQQSQQQQQQQQRPQPTNGKTVPPKTKSDKNSSTSSLSSMSSGCADCNSNVSDFSIPRPRLIVPVHTYARKRRTGNLIQVNRTTADDYDDDDATNRRVIIKQPRNSSNTTNNQKYDNGKRPNNNSNDPVLKLIFVLCACDFFCCRILMWLFSAFFRFSSQSPSHA